MMTRNFNVSKTSAAAMLCSSSSPCYCYGKICLVSNTKNCNEGNVFIDGRAFCGTTTGWELIGNHICQDLGFRNLSAVKTDGE